MNDAWGMDNSNTEEAVASASGGLRQFAESVQEQNKMLLARLDAMEKERKQEKLSSVFTNLGVPGAAALYQGEPDPEKATEWVNTMKATFGNGNVQGEVTQAPVQPVLAADQQEQYQRMSEAGQGGVPMGNFEAAAAAVGSATDVQGLIASFANAQRLNG